MVMFRPRANAARFNDGARRMAMPELPEETFVQALELLVAQDREWIPTGEGNSLYLRPFMIATQRGLGVNHPSSEYLFCVIASPAASYFGPSKTVKVWLSEDYTRAAPGGTGAVKCGGNYAAAFLAQQQAVDNGCDQVVWLDAAEHRYVEEMGGMNLYFVYGSGSSARVITPALTGTLLPGITRDSLLKVAPALGIPASEGQVSVTHWREACASGEITEVFACGTAAVITPVGAVDGASGGWTIGTGEPGPVTMRLREELHWHPVRPQAGPVRLDPQGRLTRRIAALWLGLRRARGCLLRPPRRVLLHGPQVCARRGEVPHRANPPACPRAKSSDPHRVGPIQVNAGRW